MLPIGGSERRIQIGNGAPLFPGLADTDTVAEVSTMNIRATSEYVRELIRKDQDIQQLRARLLEGASSPASAQVDAQYFEELRSRVRSRAAS